MSSSADYARSVGLDPNKLPAHVAIIMDGNGRWAVERDRPRIEGHLRGADVVRTVTTECCRLGIGQLTLYCFSAENWKRPPEEVDFLMGLLKQFLLAERDLIREQNIRFAIIGRRDGIPADVQAEMDTSIHLAAQNSGLTLCLAINYGGRTEIVDACRRIAEQVRLGELLPDQINEDTLDRSLYTAGMRDPDLLIRTAGEMRISNYLLWQISYAELWVTPLGWPDFTAATLHEAFQDFARRRRRFGGLHDVQGAV
ncbi:MAG: isoprenyl transferase [Bacteroidales bacterium]|nr:isoprenyl transferase [Bacteroidales bacterium]